MSGLKVERPRHLELKRVSFDDRSDGSHSPTLSPSPKKMRLDPEVRPRRRRTHSCSFLGDRKRRHSIVIPSKFLLGGNITDPLNLEALGGVGAARNESEHMKRGGETVRVIIPPNINDPLNLDACSEDGEEQLADAISRQRRRRKYRKRKRRNSEPTSGILPADGRQKMSASVDEDLCKIGSQPSPLKPTVVVNEARPASATRQISCPGAVDRNKNSQPPAVSHVKSSTNKCCWHPPSDRIVSPVIKQPGTNQWHYQPSKNQLPDKRQDVNAPRSYHPKNQLYQYGNYLQYYGYRNPENSIDPRLAYFQRVWFEGKDVLDIGCNIGHISFLVARDFQARNVIGIDIDRKLINVANKNFKHYLPDCASEEERFPKSMRTLYGPLKPAFNKRGMGVFPHNIHFYQNNYVLEAEELLETIKEEFNCVLCLSVTKWVHLNFGDDGMKRFFSRIYKNLRPDGLLIMEPQAWPSYRKKRKLTPKILETYRSIRFYPNDFEEYLTKILGFFHVHTFRVDHTISKGFHRLLFVFRKPTEAERKTSPMTFTHDKSSQTEECQQIYSPKPTAAPLGVSSSAQEATASPAPEAPTAVQELVISPEFRLVPLSTPPTETPCIAAGPSNNHSPESTSSKSSLVESTELLVIDVDSDDSRTLETEKTAVTESTAPAPECSSENNSPIAEDSSTVGSTTDNESGLPVPCLETVDCDSTTDEVDQSEVNPCSPLSDNIPDKL